MTIIEAVGISKSYGDHKAVDRISFSVKKGECFGILGPNGAGKTSTFKMIYGSSRLSNGDLFVNGMSVKSHMEKIKFSLGVVPQENGLDPDFSVLDNLLVFGSYYRLKGRHLTEKADEILRLIKLEDYANKPVDQLSGGMKRRLTIGRALLTNPAVVLLDEPTTGLDPQARQWIWSELTDFKQAGKTLVLTTHYMEEAETLCDRIAILNKGQILTEGTPQDLIRKHIGAEVMEFETDLTDVDKYLQKFEAKFEVRVVRNRVQVYIRETHGSRDLVSQISSPTLRVRPASLNDVFLKVAGHELVD